MKKIFLFLVILIIYLYEPLFYFPFITGCQYLSIDDPLLNRITCNEQNIWGVDDFMINNGYLIIFAHEVTFGLDGLSPEIGNKKMYFVYQKKVKKLKEMTKTELIDWAKDEGIYISSDYLK